ncbi:protein KTI12 homolog [Trichosurus vulpecula]|uniref:protein KTI12 homolog n=1 Tax=Trichosurus vulpecula TaxID=9337 RepID=UPI00186B25B2|nr:protein KTI12 homolog [Trichosurus vulpecula]
MPLVVLCGLPDSGRSRRADELRSALEAEGRPVTVVRDADVLGPGGPEALREAYSDSTREKALRAALKASVERDLGPRAVVLLDSLNYIKGFRYELYCLARAARTPLCLLYCLKPRPRAPGPSEDGRPQAGAAAGSWRPKAAEPEHGQQAGAPREAGEPPEEGSEQSPGSPASRLQGNTGSSTLCPEESRELGVTGPRAAEDLGPELARKPGPPEPGSPKQGPDLGFPPELLEALAQRFEAPDSRNRWDRPLFTVLGPEEPLPLAQIWAALFESQVPAPHQATQSQPLSSTNFLHQLDQVTSQVLAALMEAQKTAVPGDLLALPGTTERLLFTRPLSMAELSRLRRQFISYTKMHPNKENLPQLANMFLQYLGQSLH